MSPNRFGRRPLLFILGSFLALSTYFGCTPEAEIVTTDPSAPILVSRDTVLFDTLFTSVGSATRRLKILNFSNQAIVFDQIGLGRGENSPYRIYVNGERGANFEDEYLRGGDSLLLLVEVTIDPQDETLPFLERDSILIGWNGQQTHVKLLAWGQDAVFVGNQVLACNSTWTANKPYVLYDDVLVDSACELTIEPGTKIYANQGATLYVGGSLRVEGSAENKVLFQHSRLEPDFEDVPGQWGGIIFLPSSNKNSIEHAHIRNAQYGVYLGTPDNDTLADLVIGNSLIESMSLSGIIAFTSDLYAYNTQVTNCLQFAVGNLAGGNYRYDHCTFANFNNFQRNYPAVVVADNVVLANNTLLVENLYARFRNTIIWGTEDAEILADNGGKAARFTVLAENCIIQDVDESISGSNILFNIDPTFVDESIFDLHIDSLSPAINRGLKLNIPTDLEGNVRDAAPDIGAYERQ